MSVHIHTDPSTVVVVSPISQVLSVPDFHNGILWEIKWALIVGEHKFIGMKSVSEWKIVPKAGIFNELLLRKKYVILSICYHDI